MLGWALDGYGIYGFTDAELDAQRNCILGCDWGETANTKIGDLANYQRPDDCGELLQGGPSMPRPTRSSASSWPST